MELFRRLLKHNDHTIFGDAKRLISLSRETKLRLPARSRQDIAPEKFEHFTTTGIIEIIELCNENKTLSQLA